MGCLKQTSEKTQGPSLEKIINLDHFFFLVRKIRRNTRTMYSLSGVGFRILTLKLRSVWQRLQLLCGAGQRLAHLQGKLPGHLYPGGARENHDF